MRAVSSFGDDGAMQEIPSFEGARYTGVSFRTAELRDCDLEGVRIVDSNVSGLYVSGYGGPVVVNDVDVSAFVESELDRRHPERVQARAVRSGGAADFRELWATVESLWADTVARARVLGEGRLHERVRGEWSFVETMRHLVFATDAWFLRAVLDEEFPFDPFGYPATGYPEENAAGLGLQVAADPLVQPTLDEIMAVRSDRMARVNAFVGELDDAMLDRSCESPPAPGYPSPHTVRQCLGVVMNEEVEHHRYASRDLAALEAR